MLRDALVSDKLPGQSEDWGDSVQVLMDEINENQQYEIKTYTTISIIQTAYNSLNNYLGLLLAAEQKEWTHLHIKESDKGL